MDEFTEDFKKKLMDITEVSTLPQVMVRILEIITDENSSANDLAEEIAKDTSLTAKILKMVNSAYYGFYREIVKVSDAVVVLGFNEIRRLSLAVSVLDMFGNRQAEHRLRFWNHSFTCAAMCDILAKERRLHNQGAFTVGLLHDIGKSVLDQHFGNMFSTVQACMQEHSLKSHEAEKMLFGFDHGDIGYWLSERWNLPVSLSEAIHYHHRPTSAEEAPELARVVHVADKLTNEFAELKAQGLSVDEMTNEDDGLLPEEKVEYLIELENRIKDSTLVDILS